MLMIRSWPPIIDVKTFRNRPLEDRERETHRASVRESERESESAREREREEREKPDTAGEPKPVGPRNISLTNHSRSV